MALPHSTPAQLSMRQRLRMAEAEVKALKTLIEGNQATMDRMAENMTHMILRLEGVRFKFNLTVDEINRLGEEHLARESARISEADVAKALAAVTPITEVVPMPPSTPEEAPVASIPEATPA